MTIIEDICQFLDSFAPIRLAEDWDNVGLLVGDSSATVNRIMTCLTITPESAREAIEQQANLIVTHHPLPFRPLKKLTTDQTATRLLWDLIRAGISIYSPHTGFDSAREGINQALATRLSLIDTQPLVAIPNDPESLGSGRTGMIQATTVGKMIVELKRQFKVDTIQFVGSLTKPIERVAVACGSGGAFLEPAIAAGCDVLVSGETNFHTCLEASARGVALVLLGHYTSERFAIETLATRLESEFAIDKIWASTAECDPVQFA